MIVTIAIIAVCRCVWMSSWKIKNKYWENINECTSCPNVDVVASTAIVVALFITYILSSMFLHSFRLVLFCRFTNTQILWPCKHKFNEQKHYNVVKLWHETKKNLLIIWWTYIYIKCQLKMAFRIISPTSFSI